MLENVAQNLAKIGWRGPDKKIPQPKSSSTPAALSTIASSRPSPAAAQPQVRCTRCKLSAAATPRASKASFSQSKAPQPLAPPRKKSPAPSAALPVIISANDKPAYHASGTIVAGHALSLIESATQTLMKIGFTRRRANQALLPLIRQMLDNYESLGPHAAWTGPLSRGDYATISKHARALRRFPREFQDAYRGASAAYPRRVLSKKPAATKSKVAHALSHRVFWRRITTPCGSPL